MLRENITLSRRSLLAGATAAGVGLAFDAPAFAKAPLIGAQAPAFYRFKIGEFEATIVSDGPLALGEPRAGLFKDIGPDELKSLQAENFLPTDNLVVEQNALVVNTGSQLVLFDTGLGAAKMFGPNSGRLLTNLKAAGFDPAAFDAVVLSHAHPDHCWGLMNGETRLFPNAQIYLSQADFDFWTDPSKATGPGSDALKGMIEGNRAQLFPNRDRLHFIKDEQMIIPGVVAMAAPGHTIGHMIFIITSGSSSFCYAADIGHCLPVLLKYPRVSFTFDSDGNQAAATRVRVFDMLAAQRIPMLAYHFPWPGVGHLVKTGDSYRHIAVAMQTVL